MLKDLKNFDAERADVDDMIELSAFARTIYSEYCALAIEPPEWLETQTKAVRREVNNRLADLRAKRVREIKARLSTLKTAEEKRTELTEELARLETQG